MVKRAFYRIMLPNPRTETLCEAQKLLSEKPTFLAKILPNLVIYVRNEATNNTTFLFYRYVFM